MPAYQAPAVTNFLKKHPPPFTSAQFNNSGKVRAFPDLSANGYVPFFVVCPPARAHVLNPLARTT